MKRSRFDKLCITPVMVLCVLLVSCAEPPSRLSRIKERNEIRIVMRNGPSAYFVDKDGENGLEYELARRFAKRLGVELSLVIVKNSREVLEALLNGQVDIAAGFVKSTKTTDLPLDYGPDYQWVTRQLIYRTSYLRPASLEDIYPDVIHLASGTVSKTHLQQYREDYPSVTWKVHEDRENLEMLEMLEHGEILYAVAYSNDMVLAREAFPEVRTAFNLIGPRPLVWAVREDTDRTLLQAIETFHNELADTGILADLIERFYGPTGFFDYVDSRKFIDKYRKNLPALKAYFRRSGEETGIDWRLLAALSYQESHWRKDARSHTGVRGLMMLTRTTARQMGVENRLDPKQSIDGGARYLKSLIDRIPQRIQEPDRTWLALAAYNVGFGHLEDARILTEKDGGDPDRWQDVKLRLPLLSQRAWYKQTRHGYARGSEPVKFVRRIRKYYNVLVNLTQEEIETAPRPIQTVNINSPVL